MTLDNSVARTGFGRLLRGQTAIDFYGKRRLGLIAAIVVVVVTVISLFTQGLNLGLDFEGGDAWDVPVTETFGVPEAEKVLEDNGISIAGSRIQIRSSETSDVVTVQVKELSKEDAATVTKDFADAAGVSVQDISFSFTSSSWGSEITDKAIRALVIFVILVSLFISVRFEWRMALSGVAAMAHDVIGAVGVYSVFQFEVTPATVIAFLTILGYSLYDTIVVFDRVQENEGKYASVRMPYEDVVNISVNQVLMRSINTSFSSVLPVISLLVIGSGLLGAVTLREFALALLVGMVVGVYSSIFIATPLLATLRVRSNTGRKSRRPRLLGDDLRAAVMGASVASLAADAPSAAIDRSDDDGADVLVTTSSSAGQPPERLLTHPPRPRKKKRR